MTLSQIATKAQRLVADNAPAIMTAIGVSGTLMTAYLTGKASFKAAEILRDYEWEPDGREPVPTRERIELVWKEYIPAAGTAALTISAIVLANRVGTRRAAAMAVAYSLSEKAFTEYREKIVEKIGERKEQGYRDEIAQERVIKNPPNNELIILDAGEVLCHDAHSGRWFKSSYEALRRAENDLNAQLLNDYYASLTDFYNLIGLPRTSESDDVGWNSTKLLKLEFTSALTTDNRPCLSFDFRVTPIRKFYKINP